MNRKISFAVLSVLLFGASGVAMSANQPFPADAEAAYSLAPLDTYSDQMARAGDAQSERWGVGKRQSPEPHNAFPFGGGQIDD